MLHNGGLVSGDAGVVAVVVRCQVVYSQWAGEVDVVDRHTQAGGDWPSIFLPGDIQRPVARHDHARYEHTLTDSEALKLEGLDVWRDCRKEEKENTKCHF